MKRIRFNLAAAVSLGLCVLATLLAVRGWWTTDVVRLDYTQWPNPNVHKERVAAVFSGRGVIVFFFQRDQTLDVKDHYRAQAEDWRQTFPPGWSWSYANARSGPYPFWVEGRLGFARGHMRQTTDSNTLEW